MQNIFRKSSFLRNISTLTSGIVVANIITICTSLFLTRLYTPEEIGYLTFFNSAAIVLANVFTLGYELAIVTPKKNETAHNLLKGSVILLFTFSVLLMIIVVLGLITGFNFVSGMPKIWYLILPFAVFSLGLINIAQEWFTRFETYKVLSVTKIIQSIFTSIPQISIGFLFPKSIGLIIGFITGRLAATLSYLRQYSKNIDESAYKKSILETLKEYSRYPKYISPTIILDRLSLEAPYFLITFLFTESLLGFFAIAYRVLSVPMAFLGTAVGQVFFKTLSSKKHASDLLTPSLLKTWAALALLGIIPMVIILAGGPGLFQIVFGEEWAFSGTMAIMLAPMLYFDFISSPTGRSFLVLNIEHFSPFFSIARITYICISFYIGFIYDSILLGILLLSISRSVALIIQNIILFIKAQEHDKNLAMEQL